MGFSRAAAARGCGDGPTPGAVALEVAVIERWGDAGVYSLGIFNCRRVAGTDSWSLHAEGRAVDLGVVGADSGAGASLLGALLECGDQVLQRIMYDHRVYDAASPRGRAIARGDPHTDHLHVELSWAGARGDLALQLPDDTEEDAVIVPGLLVAYRGAMFAVSPDLASKVGLASSDDVRALSAAGYASVVLSEPLMASIPNG